ncbi:MAG TPA: 2-hydroxyacyl-CoA dehydratase [Dehalococcoidia bacterium]|nr:2-hydroxyacyl-CoA dehydratase [Dehalococcoidia bacterium]
MKNREVDGGKLFREWAQKYDRRVRKITENPRPGMFKGNILLYEMMRDYCRRELEAWESGRPMPVVYTVGNAAHRLWMACGFHTYVLDCFSDYLTREQAPYYLQLVRNLGFPDNTCDRVQAMAAMGICGHLPPPSMVVGELSDCDPGAQAALWAGRYWRVPTTSLDIPFEQSFEAVEYVAEQLWEMVHLAEREFPGIKYDEARLRQMQAWYREAAALERQILLISKHKPCAVAGRNALRMPPRLLYADPRYPEYFRILYHELRNRLDRGESVVKDGDEKFRVFWMCSAPFYEDPFGFLEERGCAIPLYEEGPGVPDKHVPGDEGSAIRFFGRKLENPVQEEAGVILCNHWAATGERRVREVLLRCQQVGIEGLIHFLQPGCETCNNLARVLGDRVEKELGIKNLYIEGWAQDMEKHNEAEFEAKLDDWLKVCLAEKEARQKSR